MEGLPPKISSVEVRSIFEPYGTVTFVHLARAGNGFVTFEDEDAANRALDLHGTQYRDGSLIVQPESEAAMPLPIVAVKRDIHFPKPSVGRGMPQYKSSTSNNVSHRSSISAPNDGQFLLKSPSCSTILETDMSTDCQYLSLILVC